MRNKCLFALGVVFAMSLTSIVAFAFSFTGEPDGKNDQQQIVVVNPATESEETTSEQTVSAETEDTTATLQSAGSSLSGSMDWDAEDAYMLAKIAMAEAESEDTEGKALVMLVVLNRVWSDEFPDTIAGVIFQDGQFSPISNGRYDEVKPDADCYRALQLIQIDGWDESDLLREQERIQLAQRASDLSIPAWETLFLQGVMKSEERLDSGYLVIARNRSNKQMGFPRCVSGKRVQGSRR